MPTPDEKTAVLRQIERLEQERFMPLNGSMIVVANAPDTAERWSDLTENQKLDALTQNVAWAGFDDAQMLDVISAVVEGRPESQWMPDEVKYVTEEVMPGWREEIETTLKYFEAERSRDEGMDR